MGSMGKRRGGTTRSSRTGRDAGDQSNPMEWSRGVAGRARAIRGWRTIALITVVLVGGSLLVLPREFRSLPKGAVVLQSEHSFWRKSREYVYVEGRTWCAGSEWLTRPVRFVGARTGFCLDPGRDGVFGTSVGERDRRILLVAPDVLRVEKVSERGVEDLQVERTTATFGVVRVNTTTPATGYRLIRSKPGLRELPCDGSNGGPLFGTDFCE